MTQTINLDDVEKMKAMSPEERSEVFSEKLDMLGSIAQGIFLNVSLGCTNEEEVSETITSYLIAVLGPIYGQVVSAYDGKDDDDCIETLSKMRDWIASSADDGFAAAVRHVREGGS